MQPKKRILLVGDDEIQLSGLSFLLDVNAYAATYTTSADAAVAHTAISSFDLLIVCWPMRGAAEMIEKFRERASWHCRVLLLAEKTADPPELVGIDAALTRGLSSAGILDAVKLLASRKRRPRKMGPAPAPATGLQEIFERRIA